MSIKMVTIALCNNIFNIFAVFCNKMLTSCWLASLLSFEQWARSLIVNSLPPSVVC